ncbi:MAG: MerR family transcriptional regulator, light-induced transcriptional regulator [bacterium]
MDEPGQTVSATRFAELAGVSRERLRTWERRYGFPVPHRVAGGPRRYRVDDLQRVVAVRRAAADGMPVADAIAEAGAAGPGPPAAESLAALVEHLPVPVAALSGPLPLRIEYVNAALQRLPGAPRPGADLTRALPEFAGTPCERALRRLFASDAGPVETHHPAWGGHARHAARSTLFRLPTRPAERPLVAMVGLEGDGERAARTALAAQRRELDELRRRHARHERWLEALALLATALQRQPDSGRAIAESLDVVVRQTGTVDAALAHHVAGRLVLSRSRRGRLGPSAVTVAAHPALSRALADGEALWLDPVAATAFAVPPDLRACLVPVAVAGGALGVLVLALEDVEPLDADTRSLLRAIAAAFGFALLRDRLVDELREAMRHEPARPPGA